MLGSVLLYIVCVLSSFAAISFSKKDRTLSEIKRDFPMEFPFFDRKTQIWT